MQNRHSPCLPLADTDSKCKAESSDVPGHVGILSTLDAAEEIPARPVDPTRYGDWEQNGRCIDF